MALGIVIWLKLKHEDFGPKLGSDLFSDKAEDFYYFGSELVQKTFPFSLNENAFSIKIVFLFMFTNKKNVNKCTMLSAVVDFAFQQKSVLIFFLVFLKMNFPTLHKLSDT